MTCARHDDEFVSEDDCILCGHWPAADRWALREMTDRLPLKELEQICAKCIEAFWTNCVAGPG